MHIKTNITKTLEEVNDKARYDNEVKKVLSDPQILSWILKYTIKEFKDYSISEIMACIEGKPEVATHAVHPGYYTEPVEGLPTESTEVMSQKVTYDIRFRVKVPVNSEYTITGYHMERQDRYGHMKSKANKRYDLMELVLVCLGSSENAEKGTELHQLLTTVLSEVLTPEEKIEKLKEEYDIVTTVELEGGLASMCNLSDYIEERGIEKGIEKGLSALVNTIKSFTTNAEEIYQAVIKNETYKNISRDDVLKYLE